MKSDNITVTDARLKRALHSKVNPIINQQITPKIEEVTRDSKIQVGFMTKFYPYLDKCEVDLENGKKVLCKILHRFGGEFLEFFTPQGDEDYCDELKEPCIIPMVDLKCLVLDIHDGSDEQIILGYVISDEMVGLNPAHPGNMKLSYSNGINEFWIKFGDEGLDIRLPESSKMSVGEMDDDMTPVEYASSDNVYTKEEVYTKKEVDELIAKKIAEALGDTT